MTRSPTIGAMAPLQRPFAVLTVLASLSFLAACGDDDSSGTDAGGQSSESASPAETPTGSPAAGTGTTCDYPADPMGAAKQVEPPPAEVAVSGEVAVTLATSIGDLALTLDADTTPCTVNSFVSLVEQGYYDDTTCHRLTTSPSFGVLQCGDPTASGSGGPGYTISDEVSGDETYPAGTLAMAKTAMPDSGGSQFFICYVDTQLPPEYTVFGTLDEASNQLVADAAADGTVEGSADGTPATAVDITSATVD